MKNEVLVWDVRFYKVDEDGREVRNEDSTIRLFVAPKLDWSTIANYAEEEDLEEVDHNEKA
jgi:hypothetical protein